jgi:hypothetical protein
LSSRRRRNGQAAQPAAIHAPPGVLTRLAKAPAGKLCVFCEEVRDNKQRRPVHVIHPVNGMAMLFDEGGEAVCPICQAKWRQDRTVMSLVD